LFFFFSSFISLLFNYFLSILGVCPFGVSSMLAGFLSLSVSLSPSLSLSLSPSLSLFHYLLSILGVRPFGVSSMLAGFSSDGSPQLYLNDPAGTYSAWKVSLGLELEGWFEIEGGIVLETGVGVGVDGSAELYLNDPSGTYLDSKVSLGLGLGLEGWLER
jgi:hypothetical protein